MNNPRRNILAPLFGDDTSNPDVWTREHFVLDSHMHQLIQDARDEDEITEEDLSARVSNIAKRFPSIVEMGSDAGATDPEDSIEVKPAVNTSTDPSAPDDQNENETNKARHYLHKLRKHIRENNANMLQGLRPKPYAGKAVRHGTKAPFGEIIDGLLDIIEIQQTLQEKLKGLENPGVTGGMRGDLENFSSLKTWSRDTDQLYMIKLDTWHKAVDNALEEWALVAPWPQTTARAGQLGFEGPTAVVLGLRSEMSGMRVSARVLLLLSCAHIAQWS